MSDNRTQGKQTAVVMGKNPDGENVFLQTDADENLKTVAVIRGTRSDGSVFPIAATDEGHVEVAIHSPILPFGALHTEKLFPVFQFDGVYGYNDSVMRRTLSLSGSLDTENALLKCNTGTTQFAQSVLQSRKRQRYRPGQAAVTMFTAMFSTAAAGYILVAGQGHSEDGYFVGYNGTQFGILHSRGGAREVRTLTINTASSTAQNITVTLNGTEYTVAVTNSGNTARTAWEISQGNFAGWTQSAIGPTVVFVRSAAGTASGAYSLSGTTAAGAFAQTRAGAASTETWVYQADWNGADKLDGNGPSGVALNPQRLNVFRIGMEYLGAGNVTFDVLVSPSTANNPYWATIHTFKNPNTRETPHVLNPSWPFTMAAYSAGGTSGAWVATASVAGLVAGRRVLQGPRFTYTNTSTSVSPANIQALFTVKNELTFNGKVNQSVVNVLSITAALKHTQPTTFFIIRNGTLAGNPNFSAYSATSATTWDTAATTVTFADNAQVIFTLTIGETGNAAFAFEDDVTLQPGEWLTVGARSVQNNVAYAVASINTREDQ